MEILNLTVVICTYNRANIISECLISLMEQSLPTNEFSVLIVNNNSTDNSRSIIDNMSSFFYNFDIVNEKTQGLSFARNKGITIASTPWIAFLDDDARARHNWVETIMKIIEKDDFDAFGGPYYAWHRYGPPPSWFAEDWCSYLPQSNYGLVKNYSLPVGGNCAIKRNAVIDAKAFPTEYGMIGSKIAYGEESLLFKAMIKSGYRVGFVPEMIIDHCVYPYKYSKKWIMKSYFKRGIANFDYNISYESYKFGIIKFIKMVKYDLHNFIYSIMTKKYKKLTTKIIYICCMRLFFHFGRIYRALQVLYTKQNLRHL